MLADELFKRRMALGLARLLLAGMTPDEGAMLVRCASASATGKGYDDPETTKLGEEIIHLSAELAGAKIGETA